MADRRVVAKASEIIAADATITAEQPHPYMARAVAETLTIDHLGHRGDGVALTEGATIFVAYTLPGETVEAETRADGRRHLLRVIDPSPQRIAPFCRYFGACGGCAIQHWDHDAYLAWKHGLVVDALRQAGIAADVAPLIDGHGSGRRRVTLHARRGADGRMSVGFAAPQSHDLIAIDHCPILDPALGGALPAAHAIAEALATTGKPLDIQITAASEGLDVDVRGSGVLNGRLVAQMARVADQHRLARLTRHGEMILQRESPSIQIGRARVALPPGSFLQATAAGEAALAGKVLDYAAGARNVIDLFCGVGPFALGLAERARVVALDNAPGAIAALAKAAAATPKLKPVTASVRDLFRRPLLPQELKDVDALVFDPPRQGAQVQAAQIAASRVPVVIAVSCNVATFGRDAGILIAGGYRLAEVVPIDQFRHTPHVELVAKFIR